MSKLILTLLATTALAAPAFAAPNMANPPKQQTKIEHQQTPKQQSQTQNPTQQKQHQASNQVIPPRDLSRNQVRELQTALNKDGFKIGRVDGMWGPRTRDAVEHFQESKKMPTKNGTLTRNTLAALGVNLTSQQHSRG